MIWKWVTDFIPEPKRCAYKRGRYALSARDDSEAVELTSAADVDERVAAHNAQRRQPQQTLGHCPSQSVRLAS